MSRPARFRFSAFTGFAGFTGFTLVELAVALLIVGLLLAAAMIPLTTQVDLRNAADTRRVLDQIKEAIIAFAQANGRLPCPARGQTAAATIDTVTWAPAQIAAGAEQYDTANARCYTALGVVPWATLGVPETDSWGRRFSYRVSPAFADDPTSITLKTWSSAVSPGGPPALPAPQTVPAIRSPANQNPACDPSASSPTQASFALCSLGDIAVLTRNYANHALVTPLGTGLPAVIVSHGKNGYGAFQPNGQGLTPSAGADELANSNGTAQATPGSGYNYLSNAYYSRDPTPSAAGCSDTTGTLFCEFDDIVTWISSSTLVGRMVSAGRLP